MVYAGKVVEEGPAAEVLADPAHPYTAALLRSLPPHARQTADGTMPPSARSKRLPVLPGTVGQFSIGPTGCAFATRCERVHERCRNESPPLVTSSASRSHRCFAPLHVAREGKSHEG
ncbi:MAG: oligopeptide/dipeptide ABC transporter ATP-binding protein [Myxococcota bacterium]